MDNSSEHQTETTEGRLGRFHKANLLNTQDLRVPMEQKSTREILRNCRILVIDADDTLVHTDPEYYRKVTRLCLEEYCIGEKKIISLISGLDTAQSIRFIQEQSGIGSQSFWDTFEKYDDIDQRLQATQVFPDVSALSKIQSSRDFFMLTHAPALLAYGYSSLIYHETGVDFPIVQTIHNYPEPQEINKPDPRLVTDMLIELGYIDPLLPFEEKKPMSRPIFSEIAVVGDSPQDLKLAHNLPGAIAVWINRGNQHHLNTGFRYMEFSNFVEFVNAAI